tara:strand:- start:2662 stop:2970 length:309 start_codon:yes stop_codon:yes gene_type:complete
MSNIKQLEDNEFCFIVDNDFRVGDEHELFFQCPAEDVTVLPETATMLDVLVQVGIFKSKSQARKDPKWGKNLEIPQGFTHFPKLGKKRRDVAILRPMEIIGE